MTVAAHHDAAHLQIEDRELDGCGGAMVAGYDRILRVNEPGRTFWVKAQFTLK